MELNKIFAKLGITELNGMQKATAEALTTSSDDVVVISPTGTGKTLAYMLPLLDTLNPADDNVQMVVIVPGHELALQSANVMRDMGTGLRAMSVYGGRPTMDEHRAMRKTLPQVLFATPGRLNDHLAKGNFDPSRVTCLVIDEFDKCLAMGFHEEMRKAVENLSALRRRVLLSATDADSIPHFVRIGKVRKLDFSDDRQQVERRVSVYTLHSKEKDKLKALEGLLRCLGDGSSIVFLNYRDSVERTDDFLKHHGFTTSAFHGGLDQRQREDAIYKFANGSSNILVATDLASRGLDIPDVDNIIHYHLPLRQEEYVHRVGRTARWEALGSSYFIIGPEEELPEYVDDTVEEFSLPEVLPQPTHPRMATLYIGKGKKDKVSKGDIVGFLCKKGGLDKNEVGKVDVMDRYAYAAVAYGKVKQVIERTKGEKIKGLRTIVEPVR